MPPWHMTADQGRRPNTDSFCDDADAHMSVYVETRLVAMGLTATAVLDGHDGYGLVAFPVGLVRAFGWDAVLGGADSSDPFANAHAEVIGDKRARGPRLRLARESTLVHWPPLAIGPAAD